MIDYRVYLITDNPSRYRGDWLDSIRAAVEGGVTVVQYRDTESDAQEQYRRILRLRDAIGKVPVVVNNSAELALAAKAEGVHVGQGDLAPREVRAIVGPKCEIGLSITDKRQLVPIEEDCVDCIGIGPVFDARKTKADAAAPLGLSGLGEICELSKAMPNCAIGGITLDNAREVIDRGARGLALVSAFSQSEDPYHVAKSFRMLFDRRRQ